MEATGIYYLDLAVALAKANLPVSVINPKSFHHFAPLKLNGNKTDAVDVRRCWLNSRGVCHRGCGMRLKMNYSDFGTLAGSSTG